MFVLWLLVVSWPLPLLAQPTHPLGLGEGTDLYQRVITLPGARLFEEPNPTARVLEAQLAVFEVFYVYGRRGSWVQVGRQAQGPPQGWIHKDKTEQWSIMLVMQYAQAGQRERVLFFEKLETLRALVQDVDVVDQAKRLLLKIDKSNNLDTGVIAIEELQKGYVSFDSNPYLMPILDSLRDEFDDGRSTRLVKVGGINAQSGRAPVSHAASNGRTGGGEGAVSKARRAIVFVIDTTISMAPYIHRARETARRIYEELGKAGLLENTAFGLVGYRNNIDHDARLEYVTKNFVDLNPSAAPNLLLEGLRAMGAARVPTASQWDEDAVAGLYAALDMNWEPFEELRMVVLITDAGALSGDDPKARHYDKRLALWNVRVDAMQNDIVIVPIHLLTQQARAANNITKAANQYTQLGYTGDSNVSKYLSISAGSETAFARQLDDLATELGSVLRRATRGVAETKPELVRFEGGFTLGSLFRNEVYSAQQRYLGQTKGSEVVTFFPSWAADRDLTQPQHHTLEVRVFLTRNQFNELAQSLARIVERADQAKDSSETFFARLQALALKTTTDPEHSFDGLANAGLLPNYLKLLPYKSPVLSMTNAIWRSKGASQQLQFLDGLQSKLAAFERINADQRKWKELGGDDPGLQVYPVPLEVLP